MSNTYFLRAKQIIDEGPYVDRLSGDPAVSALTNDGPYAATGLRVCIVPLAIASGNVSVTLTVGTATSLAGIMLAVQ